jgi:hypothetical protein
MIDLTQDSPPQPIHNYQIEFHIAFVLMVGVAVAYWLSQRLWHQRQG